MPLDRRLLDGVRIRVHDDKHCSMKCPLMLPDAACVLLVGTRWCLGLDGDVLDPNARYRRCGPCRRLERK